MANFPLLSIPIYYMLIHYPSAHATFFAGRSALKNRDNTNPHGEKNKYILKKHLSAKEFATYERAERCHRNGLENMPLFVAAIFAGILAEEKAGVGAAGLNTFAVGGLIVRLAYTFCYISTESQQWAPLRSLMYNVGVFWAFAVIIRAALKLG